MEPAAISIPILKFRNELNALAYTSPTDDACLSNPEKIAQLRKIDELLKREPLFNETDLPELFFLKDRVERIAPNSEKLLDAIDAQIKRINSSKCSPEAILYRDMSSIALRINKLKPSAPNSSLLTKALDEKVRKSTDNFSKELPPPILKLLKEFFEKRATSQTLSWCEFVKCIRVVQLSGTESLEELVRRKMDMELLEHGVDIDKLKSNKRDAKSPVISHMLKTLTMNTMPADGSEITDAHRLEKIKGMVENDCKEKNQNPIFIIINDKELLLTRLIISVILGLKDCVKQLLRNGYNVNETGNQKYTPAQFAAIAGDYEMLFL